MDPVTSSPATPPPASPKRGWRIALASTVVVVLAAGTFLGFYLPNRQHSSAAGTINQATTGCPAANSTPANPPVANETIHESDANRATAASVGDIVSISLPSSSTFYWTYQNTPTNALQQLTPTGYYAASQHACVWNFKATGAGQNALAFVRQPTCHKGAICPPIEIIFRFTLIVH